MPTEGQNLDRVVVCSGLCFVGVQHKDYESGGKDEEDQTAERAPEQQNRAAGPFEVRLGQSSGPARLSKELQDQEQDAEMGKAC